MSDDELREALFEAAAAPDTGLVSKLATGHLERIVELFPAWKKVPPAVRSDPPQLERWAQGVITVAHAVAALGNDSLLAQVMARPEDEVLGPWGEAYLTAQADVEARDYASAIKTLEPILEKNAEVAGTGVDDLRAKSWGMLGIAYFRAGDKEQARVYTSKAKDLCARIGDPEGVETYTEHLKIIDLGARLVFHDEQGRLLTSAEVQAATGKVHYGLQAAIDVPLEATRLHEQGREAGERLDYDQALVLFTRAAELAPHWPHPVYDRAHTHLLMDNFDAALADYRKTREMVPRGFFTTLTAIHTLLREERGDLPRGLYRSYLMLESIVDAKEKRVFLQKLLDESPGFAPAWQQLAYLTDDASEKEKAIERGLAADPDPETRGMLLLNEAVGLIGSGQREAGTERLRALANDPESTLATEALAKSMLERYSKI
jgi:tetratricopeptide (TPR) repeat protein